MIKKAVDFLYRLPVVFIFIFSMCAQAKESHVVLDQLSVDDGLSQATIYTILQDEAGFMWFGNESGINIYDGHTVKRLLGPNGEFPTLSSNVIRQDSSGKIWLSFWMAGLYTYDPKTHVYEFILQSDSKIKDSPVLDVLEDELTNNIWIVTEKSVLLYQQDTKEIIQRVDLSEQLDIKRGTIFQAFIHGKHLFIGTKVGLFVYSMAKNKLIELPKLDANNFPSAQLTNKDINQIYTLEVYQEALFFGTNNGVFSVLLSDVEQLFVSPSLSINYQLVIPNISLWVMEKTEDRLYMGATDGLHEYIFESKSYQKLFEYSDYDRTVAASDVLSLIVDKHGAVWLGSRSAGAFVWEPYTELITSFRYYKGDKQSLAASSVSSIHVSKHQTHHLWVGSDKGLSLINLEGGDSEFYLKNNDHKTTKTEGNIYSIAEDEHKRLWLNTELGMRLFDLNKRAVIPFPYSEENNQWLMNIYAVTLLHKEVFWAVSEDGFYQLDVNSGVRTHFTDLPVEINLNQIYNIMPSPSQQSHEIFISTYDTLWLFNASTNSYKKIYQHPNITTTTYPYFDTWQLDADNNLWLGLYGIGLLCIDGETNQLKYSFTQEQHGVNSNIYSLKLDSENNLWFATHAGLYRLNLSNHHIRNFNVADGLITQEFNSGAHATLADGRFAFGGVSGLSLFDPIKLGDSKKNVEQEVTIVGISTLSRDLSLPVNIANNSQINLKYSDVGIRIDFTGFVYGQQDKPLYEYRFINGANYPASKQDYAVFSALESGEHIFEVRAKSSITGNYSKPKRIILNVSYAPWRSPTAIALYIVAIILFVFTWQRRRILRQHELLKAHRQVKYRENRLQLALSGSNSEVWDWKAKNNEIFSKRLVNDLGYEEANLTHTFDEHLELIHPEDINNFLTQWKLFLVNSDRDKSFEISYRLRAASGDWLWFKDLGKIVAFDRKGMPDRVTGSYTNITESKANIERAQYYGAAFEQTKDWVFIINESFSSVRVNRSMAQVFGWQQEELKFNQNILGLSKERIKFYYHLFPKILTKGHWRGEELVTTPQGKQYHVIINISLSKGEHLQHTHFICVLTDITAQKSAEKELRYMANYDHLTGLPNRTLLLDRITHAIENSTRQDHSIALFFIDLDRFKQVNDSLGHDYGDLLLKDVTQRLVKALRIDDTVARIGGDEFVVLLESYRSNNELSHIAQKIINILQQPVKLKKHDVSIGASIGISLFPEDSSSSDELLRNADVAMYYAKQQGRNNYQFFAERMNEEAKQRLSKESNLKLAVTNDEFFNLYQPIIDANLGVAIGAELLMRWEHKGNIVSPIEFIPLAEELGLILEMTDMALKKGIVELKKWREIYKDFYLSINFSAEHFSFDELVPSIEHILMEYQLPADALKIEVTENAFISDPERAIKVMNGLKALGVRLSLDDFGTGFSSLAYLKKLPLDIIKIDRSFICGIGVEKTDEAIVDATLVLAKSLNMLCIAEGVETQEQLKYLMDRQCFYIQGYLYAKPLSPHQLYYYIEADLQKIKLITS